MSDLQAPSLFSVEGSRKRPASSNPQTAAKHPGTENRRLSCAWVYVVPHSEAGALARDLLRGREDGSQCTHNCAKEARFADTIRTVPKYQVPESWRMERKKRLGSDPAQLTKLALGKDGGFLTSILGLTSRPNYARGGIVYRLV